MWTDLSPQPAYFAWPTEGRYGDLERTHENTTGREPAMTSMLYTMGTALSRAADNGLTVSILVEGCWLEGQVAASDGVGVVVESADGAHSVIRTERISVVKVHAESPYRNPLPSGSMPDAARPMPGQPAYA
jgi:hypothetical protein